MSRILVLLFSIAIISCTSGNEEIAIKEMTKAADVLSRQNLAQFHRIEKLYNSDTTHEIYQGLYSQLSTLRNNKEKYKEAIKSEGEVNYSQLNKEFFENSLKQLDTDEQKLISDKFKDSPIVNNEVFENLERNSSLPFMLALESELITQEMFLIILKDFKKKKTDFDWEIYW